MSAVQLAGHALARADELERQLAEHSLTVQKAARVDEVEKRLAEQSLAVQRAEASAAAEATRVVGRIDVLEQSTTAKLRDATELGQALRAQVAEVQAHVAKLDAANRLVSARCRRK